MRTQSENDQTALSAGKFEKVAQVSWTNHGAKWKKMQLRIAFDTHLKIAL